MNNIENKTNKKKIIIWSIILVVISIIIITITYFVLNTKKEPIQNIIGGQTNSSNLTEDVQQIVDKIKQIDTYELIDKSTVINSMNKIPITGSELNFYGSLTGEYKIHNFRPQYEVQKYLPLEYEPILYMNKDNKKLLAVKANNSSINGLYIRYKEVPTETFFETEIMVYYYKEAIILYDITSIEPQEIQKFYMIKISDYRFNVDMNEHIIEIGYGQGNFNQNYLEGFYNSKGEELKYLLSSMSAIDMRDIVEFDPKGKYEYTNMTGIEKAIKDGLLEEKTLTEGISEETLRFLCSDGNLQMYYDNFEKCLEDARKLNILREPTEEELKKLEDMP